MLSSTKPLSQNAMSLQSSGIKKLKWTSLLLFIILALGIFLRTYHFSDWLLFEIDQTYDTRIVSEAIQNGPESLPLLGPTAGGGRALRLGPAFYYMEYVSALVFGDTPVGHAILVLLSSILAMPIFYLFCRRYFRTSVAITLLALFSGSVFLVLYGRFSWSPNVLPFLILLSFYTLLRSVSSTEPRRDLFFLIATTAIGITSQIHFNAFFTIPTIAVLFLFYKRPRFNWKTWIAAFGIILTLYSPMIMNDVITHGENISLFFKKVSKSGPSGMFTGISKKFFIDLQYNASGYFFVTSGIDHINGGYLKGHYGFGNANDQPWRLFAITLFLVELILLAISLKKESSHDRRDFLVLISLWIVIPFGYFYSLLSGSFHFYPRFYLLVAPVALILFGILLETLHSEKNRIRHEILLCITILFLVPSMTRIHQHFDILANPDKNTSIEREDIFPNDARLTLKEQLVVTDFMSAAEKKNGYPIYIDAVHEYKPVFWYHLAKQGIAYTGEIHDDSLYAQGNYFSIKYPGSSSRSADKAFSIVEKKNFGALVAYTLSPDPEHITSLHQPLRDTAKLEQTTQIQALKTWKDVFQYDFFKK